MLSFAARDTALAYLAEGVTEDVATTLGRIDRLVVKTPSAVRRAQRLTPGNLRAIGAALGVRYLVDGGLRRAGERYRVTVRLVRVADEVTAWGQTYDRTTEQLWDTPAEIAAAVSSFMGQAVTAAERSAFSVRPTRDPQAYEEYVRGNFLIAGRRPEQALLAVRAYERALQRDSNFVPALSREALAYALFLDWPWPFPGLTRDSMLARGTRSAERAVRLDPGSSDAWLARGYMLAHERPRTFDGVLGALDSATRLDPKNAEAWHQTGYFRWLLRQDSAALVALGRALEVDPARGITLEHIARVLFFARRYEEARRWIDSAIVMEPATPWFLASRGRIELLLGNLDEGRRDAERAAAVSPLGVSRLQAAVTAGLIEVAAGDTAAAQRRVAALLASLNDSGPIAYSEGLFLAMLTAQLGDREASFRLLERVRPVGITFGRYLDNPAFDLLRADPRFQRLVEESKPR